MLSLFCSQERKPSHEDKEQNLDSQTSPLKRLFFPPQHIVAFYTLLTVLIKMKKELGLEAMLEYMAMYLNEIDSHNPKLSIAVAKTLETIPIEVFYHELGKNCKDKN